MKPSWDKDGLTFLGRLLSLSNLKKRWLIEETKVKGPNTVNNALFVGSTAELQKLLKNGLPKDSK